MLAQIEAQPGEDMQLTQLGVRNSMLTAAGVQARRSLVRAFIRTLDESNTAATAAAPASLRRGASAAGPASRDDAPPL